MFFYCLLSIDKFINNTILFFTDLYIFFCTLFGLFVIINGME